MEHSDLVKASPNFKFLKGYNHNIIHSLLSAERNVFADPVIALICLRQFGEFIAQEVAANVGIYFSSQEKQNDLLKRLRDRNVLTFELSTLFHDLRKVGNN